MENLFFCLRFDSTTGQTYECGCGLCGGGGGGLLPNNLSCHFMRNAYMFLFNLDPPKTLMKHVFSFWQFLYCDFMIHNPIDSIS